MYHVSFLLLHYLIIFTNNSFVTEIKKAMISIIGSVTDVSNPNGVGDVRNYGLMSVLWKNVLVFSQTVNQLCPV